MYISRRLLQTSLQSKTKVEFFYDVISPYTWLAFEVFMRYKQRWNIDLHLKPVILAGITKATGNDKSLMVTNRARYLWHDIPRSARYYHVPIRLIENPLELMLVKGSLIPNRFLTAIALLYPQHLEEASRSLWMAQWNRDEDFTSPEVLTRAGLDAGLNKEQLSAVQEHMTAQVTKDTLRANTDQAVEYGAFGSPSIIAHIKDEPKLFFGSDRFHILCEEIGEKWEGPDPDGVGTL